MIKTERIIFDNFIDFLLEFKSDIDKGSSYKDFLTSIDNDLSYQNTIINKIITIKQEKVGQIPGLPNFRSFWAHHVVDWLKVNGSNLEKVSKLRGFL